MIEPETSKRLHDYTAGAWVAIGPLVGVLIGAWVANRNERKHWIADNKKQEYRELLSAIVEASGNLIAMYTPNTLSGPEEQIETDRTEKKARVIIMDRIFIARDVNKMKLAERWASATDDVHSIHDVKKFADRFAGFMTDIVNSALKIIE